MNNSRVEKINLLLHQCGDYDTGGGGGGTTADAQSSSWHGLTADFKRIFNLLSRVLVPGTFGHGPNAVLATSVATGVSLCLWLLVIYSAVGSVQFFLRSGRVNDLLTVVSLVHRVNIPNLAICSMDLFQTTTAAQEEIHASYKPRRNHHHPRSAARLRWTSPLGTSLAASYLEPCGKYLPDFCSCVFPSTLQFWDGSSAVTQNKPYFSSARGPGLEETFSYLVDLSDFPEDSHVWLGLFEEIHVINDDPPSWIMADTNSQLHAALVAEGSWELELHRHWGFIPLPTLRLRRALHAETLVLDPDFKINAHHKALYSLEKSESLVFSDAVAGFIGGMLPLTPKDMEKVKPQSPIPELMMHPVMFNWKHQRALELILEYRSFSSTESFRIGQRIRFINVMGVIVSVATTLTYLDLFDAIFPRYRGRRPRLAVSKFVRIISCGFAAEQHATTAQAPLGERWRTDRF